jgi:geranyl-CoA carboxylase alpha subunit
MRFNKILIANRGEIACRVIRTARAEGYRTVAVYSEADADAPHVTLADQAVCIGPAPVGQSYLNVEAILAAAKKSGAEAVHPGYGFLAENAAFAGACFDAGLIFIGPPVEAIELMGNKRLAKLRMEAANVPCVPGYSGEDQGDARLIEEAGRIGFPLMVKAAAGGGGRGMRLVRDGDDLGQAISGARSEAQNAFGSGELILEKAVSEPRHVEIQVFADQFGHCIHLGERDCSIQRRHQKVVEEAPSPAVDEDLRQRMGEAAVAAARAVGYVGAGTVEFLLGADGAFYFLEMNTRLQVEHPVTEAITGQDLVRMQIDVAQGERLDDRLGFYAHGHAIEVRLYAEDPANGFLPQTGRIAAWRPADGVRTDDGIAAGQTVTPFYDPMIAKVIAHGETREDARRKLIRALEDTVLLGLPNNKDFLLRVLRHEAFANGSATTAFIPTHFPDDNLVAPAPDERACALAAALLYRQATGSSTGWRTAAPALNVMDLRCGERQVAARVSPRADGGYDIAIDGGSARRTTIVADGGDRVRFEHDGLRDNAGFAFDGATLYLDLAGTGFAFHEFTAEMAARQSRHDDGRLTAPMAGRIIDVRADAGSEVCKGDILVILEAMKMEHEIKAGADGTVDEVRVAVGDQVDARQLLVVLTANETAAA